MDEHKWEQAELDLYDEDVLEGLIDGNATIAPHNPSNGDLTVQDYIELYNLCIGVANDCDSMDYLNPSEETQQKCMLLMECLSILNDVPNSRTEIVLSTERQELMKEKLRKAGMEV